jgi:hypothetical protein
MEAALPLRAPLPLTGVANEMPTVAIASLVGGITPCVCAATALPAVLTLALSFAGLAPAAAVVAAPVGDSAVEKALPGRVEKATTARAVEGGAREPREQSAGPDPRFTAAGVDAAGGSWWGCWRSRWLR